MISKTDGDLHKALDDMDTAIKKDSKDTDKYLTRGIIYCKLNMYLPAIDDFNIALKLNKNNHYAAELRTYAIKSLTNY